MDNYNRQDPARDSRGDQPYGDRPYQRHDGGGRDYNRDRGDYRGGGGRDYNRDRGDYRGGGGRDYNRDRGDYRGGGGRDYNRDRGNYRGGGGRDYNRDRGDYRGGGERDYRGGGRDYNRDRGDYRGGGERDYRGGGRDYNRDRGDYRGGGERDYRGGGRDYNRDRGDYRGGGGRGGYNRDRGDYRGGGRGGYNRGGGGYRGGRGGGRPNYDRPRRKAPPIAVPDSPFLLPEHPLTQDFQRAIGMAKGTIVDVDPRKKRGIIEIDGFKYKFEDERKRELQRKYPIQKFKDREIQFAFWPTYSQKAAQYRKIDETPTIKIANLRRTLPQPNMVEIIGQVLMIEEELFVISIFSASQKKKYMVTILGAYPGQHGDFIQMFGALKNGGIVYDSHRVVSVDAEQAEATT